MFPLSVQKGGTNLSGNETSFGEYGANKSAKIAIPTVRKIMPPKIVGTINDFPLNT
jgi:hypothetical protein